MLSRIREDPGSIVIQVRNPSDPAAAAAALERAGREIEHLDAGPASAPGLGSRDRNPPAYVSPVLPSGSGPVLMIDGADVPYAVLRTIPDVVARHLSKVGVTAVVACPRQGGPLTNALASTPLREGADVPGVVVAGLYPPPPGCSGRWPVTRTQTARPRWPPWPTPTSTPPVAGREQAGRCCSPHRGPAESSA